MKIRKPAFLKPNAMPITDSLEYLTDCFEQCPADRSLEPSQLTTFHQSVRSIPGSVFPANHPVHSSMEDIVALPMRQALAVGEYWIAMNQLAKAKIILNRLHQQDERDCRVQDAIFRATWYATHGLPRQVGNEMKGRYCPYPFEKMEISVGGKVFFCCADWLPLTIGNLFQAEEMDDVWNSETAKEIRKTIIDGSYRYCRKIHCPLISGAHRNQLKKNIPIGYSSARQQQTGRVSVPPTQLALNYDRSCNLSCPSCRHEKEVAVGVEAERMMQVTKDIISPMLSTASCVSLNGAGEPLVSPALRWVLAQLASAENPALIVDLQTNGLLFREREWSSISGLGRLNLLVNISIDASEASTYARLRRGGDFNLLLNNLEFLKNLRKQDAIKSLRFRCVVQEENIEQLESFVLMAKRYNADTVLFQMFHDWGIDSSREVARKMVHGPGHPCHQKFLNNLLKALSHGTEIQILHEFEYLLTEYLQNVKSNRATQQATKPDSAVPATGDLTKTEFEKQDQITVVTDRS